MESFNLPLSAGGCGEGGARRLCSLTLGTGGRTGTLVRGPRGHLHTFLPIPQGPNKRKIKTAAAGRIEVSLQQQRFRFSVFFSRRVQKLELEHLLFPNGFKNKDNHHRLEMGSFTMDYTRILINTISLRHQ